MLLGVITSTLSSWGITFATLSEQYVDWGKKKSTLSSWGIKNRTPTLNNMLLGVITSTLSSWGITFANLSEQYVDWGRNINFIFMRDQKSHPPSEQYVGWGKNINYIFMRDQNPPPPLNNMLAGVIASTLSSCGIKICHLLWKICWMAW